MPNRNEKVLISLAAAAGIGVGTFLLIKHRKNVCAQFLKTKDSLLHDFAQRPRTKFDLHVINTTEECRKILKIIRE